MFCLCHTKEKGRINITRVSYNKAIDSHTLFIDAEGTEEDHPGSVTEVLRPIRVLDYNHSEKVFDNSIFYRSFVNDLVECLGLTESIRDDLLVNTNIGCGLKHDIDTGCTFIFLLTL